MIFNVKQNQKTRPSADLDGPFSVVESSTVITIEVDDWRKEEREVANRIVQIVHDFYHSKYPDRAWLIRKYLNFMSKFKAKKRPK